MKRITVKQETTPDKTSSANLSRNYRFISKGAFAENTQLIAQSADV